VRYGHFDNNHREYVVERPDVPVSWTNYLGVRDFCTVISQNAGGYSFHQNAEHHRITRFRPNGVPLDRPGHYVYLRDNQSGDYWSLSWQPVGKPLESAKYECRHGLSYSKFTCDYAGIEASQTLFIPVNDDVELWDVRLKNTGSTPRELSVFGYLEFSFHHIEIDNQNLQMSLYASGASYEQEIIEYDFYYEPWTYHYFASSFPPDGYDTTRDHFLGNYRTESNPLAVERGYCGKSAELGGNHCGALQKNLRLEPGEEARLIFMLGVGRRSVGAKIKARYGDPAAVDAAFAELAAHWQHKLEALQCRTPHPALDTMVNIWTLYQAETCVVWSRFASFIEVGGRTGLGYRDTSQDVMSVVHTNPTRCRQRILELLRGQVSAGYGLHLFDHDWFDPARREAPKFKSPTIAHVPDVKSMIHGLEHVCSDDALWLVPTICEYVKETGDEELLQMVVPFADEGEATVYEHMKRALEFSAAQVGATGICKGLRADWNDCLNLGGGESAMVSFLHHWALSAFVEAAAHLGCAADVATYSAMAGRVRECAERELWDGAWYIRGITANGLRIGTKDSEEGRVFIESNTWAVVSDAAAPERARAAMDAVDQHLYSEFGLHLVWPSFSRPNDDIGFMGRVYRGVKENGAIFSHPNPWAVIAECKLGRGARAMKFYDSLLPANQNDRIEVREAEPYSYCQFVMGSDHTAFGRARHPWLTGSAGWNYTAVTRWILGVRLSFDGLIVDPCVPGWKKFTVTRRWRGAQFHITVENPEGLEHGVKFILLDGHAVSGAIPPQAAAGVHQVLVRMGRP
jgi:N,N'-diacetylchitobiose phosphorylase